MGTYGIEEIVQVVGLVIGTPGVQDEAEGKGVVGMGANSQL